MFDLLILLANKLIRYSIRLVQHRRLAMGRGISRSLLLWHAVVMLGLKVTLTLLRGLCSVVLVSVFGGPVECIR